MKKISVFAIKGGIGKTTVVLTLGLGFASLGKKVLLVDEDLNSDLSYRVLGEELTQFSLFSRDKHGVGGMVMGSGDINPVTLNGNIDILPMEPDALIRADQRLITTSVKVPEKYDYVLFDTPPSYDSIVAENIMKQSDYIFSVVAPSYQAIRTVQIELNRLLPLLTKDLRNPPGFVGIIKNMLYLTRGEGVQSLMSNLEEVCKSLSVKHYTPCILDGYIPMRGRIYNYDKIRLMLFSSLASKSYSSGFATIATSLAKEFENRMNALDRGSN